ncbi:MAG TPA: hypothetical protein VMF67_10000 [Rhizomicrobium sp.]|nr:hypothetical protein [Rhizomicrobium sp.]
MYGNYSVQIQSKNAPNAKMREKTFADFAALYDFVRAFDHNGPDAINVHLPACTSDDEHGKIKDCWLAAN